MTRFHCLFAGLLSMFIGGCAKEFEDADVRLLAGLEAELAQLELDIIQSEDISAIKRLTRTYGYYLDKGLWQDLADLFADNATVDVPAGVFVGKQSVRNHFLHNLGAGKIGLGEDKLFDHLMLQPIIHIEEDGRHAKGRWRAFAMTGRFGESATWAEGPYEIEYVKEDGVWKIEALTYYETFTAPYENGGWGSQHDRNRGAARPLAHRPDRLRDPAACPAYPGACLPPFHYKNPVSGR